MEGTPTRQTRSRTVDISVLDETESIADSQMRSGRIRKPPPITPRRFNKFFTPRPREATAAHAVKTSRKALKTISASGLNTRRTARCADANALAIADGYLSANENQQSRKKRKFSGISSYDTTPDTRCVSFLPSSQDALPSSPIKYGREPENDMDVDDSDASTEIDEAEFSIDEDDDLVPTGPAISQFSRMSVGNSILSSRLGRSRRVQIADTSDQWQHETANFYSTAQDVNNDLLVPHAAIIPFSMASCNTNPVVATGDEEGVIRFLNTTEQDKDDRGFNKSILQIQPHDNAIMDMAFSTDDFTIATASGDQTCQITDVQNQRTTYSLRAHHASVKRVAFQPGTGDKLLASAGRDGQICFWDLRVPGTGLGAGRRARARVADMAQEATVLSPVLEIYDAHSPNPRGKAQGRKPYALAARSDFSITSLTFLGESRNNLLATASEVDTVIKVWDLRQSQVSARKKGHSQCAVSVSQQPRSHEIHRKFGINSIALSTDQSRLFALSRDHTVYAYSTAHLILGTSPELSGTNASKTLAPMRTESHTGAAPLYGLRHPQLRVATFWPRLAVRKCSETNSELLAVASTDDCTVLFPTSEKYHTKSARSIPALHEPSSRNTRSTMGGAPTSRPALPRQATQSFTSLFSPARQEEDALCIYYHGTPLVHGHRKEVTSVAWSSEGNLVTASDDFTVRCWREDADKARKLRELKKGNHVAEIQKTGWSHVGIPGWDDME